MLRTRVGYSGGQKANPNYHDIGDHTETVEIDFDPKKLSFRKLMEVYSTVPDLGVPAFSRQYRNAVFYHNADQMEIASEVLASKQVDIEAFRDFTLAEGYHQKYYLQNSSLGSQLAHLDLVNSTAAARVNGYVTGSGRPADIQANIGKLGLDRSGQQALIKLARAPMVHCQ